MEDNKLIAEFMGMTYGDPNDDSVMIQKTPQGNEVVPIESMEYYTSWEWLMPVVIKIGGTANILGAMKKLRNYSKVTNREDTYQAVVEFIKTYNDGRV